MIRIFHRIGPNIGISYSPWLWFFVFVGAFPFIVIYAAFYVAMWGLAIALMVLLALNGIIFHMVTGRDARVRVPGSECGRTIEFWMEDKGWIRLRRDLQELPPWMSSTTSTSRRGARK